MRDVSRTLTADACIQKIEYLREKMMDAAKKYGLNHPLVLQYSQELDHAHNIMLRLDGKNIDYWESHSL
ncbi:aspartyl-phosphate phosphatase Spo0E family protein [Halalkalibacterium halodurans]|uniref:aspartyl-phosphate phosphatase Spo0E family protein n=1 Tax=Halalkalibacterium halodurans TaxID=86665 RepID=UPI001F2FA1DF|nr:aspartyl-phosphate phosphatase Spo0E family protein [Halalkalibacterium halodurans]MED4083234.1 aspartyl-phosphate phosphatase Spo0E family protein [Halalkalibacterium halodurans]MED4086759.1 aspartyl-phosphate phosphatase Spo0E family protein [Halalkalibacterium halodurans]MED4104921.1 aspartyl-phosphate phosphatase Spo0E family protein [Halalkalibacterium halodurans]MED4110421.1 aspartyl-phosphate phosphatase Spo0E family protein [Halalkalibacterium halodurans]MED4151263.1 aspartyl-phosph